MIATGQALWNNMVRNTASVRLIARIIKADNLALGWGFGVSLLRFTFLLFHLISPHKLAFRVGKHILDYLSINYIYLIGLLQEISAWLSGTGRHEGWFPFQKILSTIEPALKNISIAIDEHRIAHRSQRMRNFARAIKNMIAAAIVPSMYILAVSRKSLAYFDPNPAKMFAYFVASNNAIRENTAIITAVIKTHLLSAEPAEVSPCIPAPTSTEQHRTGRVSQMIGLTLKKGSQKANIVPRQKIIIMLNRRAARSIENPIISAAIGM